VLKTFGHFARGREEEGEASGRTAPDYAELPVIEAREATDLRQIPLHQGLMLPIPQAADPAYASRRFCIAKTAAERVAGVRRVGDHAPIAQYRCGKPDEPWLRVGWMNAEVLSHATTWRDEPRPAARRLQPIITRF
jgi:hypothetical protein